MWAAAGLVAIGVALVVWYLRGGGESYDDEDHEDSAAAASWRCPEGYRWSGLKQKGKECKKDDKFSGTYLGKPGAWVCPWGHTWSGSKEQGKECKSSSSGKLTGPIRLSGGVPSPQCPEGTLVHDGGDCWNHNGSEDWTDWTYCPPGNYVGTHQCQPGPPA